MLRALTRVRWWQWLIVLLVAILIVGAVSRGGDQGSGGATPNTAPSPASGAPPADGSGP